MARLLPGFDPDGVPTRRAVALTLGLSNAADEEDDAHPSPSDLAKALGLPTEGQEDDATFPLRDAVQAINLSVTFAEEDPTDETTIGWTGPPWVLATAYKVEKRLLRYRQGTTGRHGDRVGHARG